jgi:bifunctional non-homologous end joining protein LigD
MRFVVQELLARPRHFELRLEQGGIYKSWALVQKPPDHPGLQRVVTQAEDRDLIFGSFEGTIPDGEYAGEVRIWDQGEYVCHEWGVNEIRVDLHGQRLKGPYQLVRAPHLGERYWLFERLGGAGTAERQP